MLPSEITEKYGRNHGPAVLDMLIAPINIVPNHAFRQLGITWHLATGKLPDARDLRDTTATLA